ncbi:MAG: RNA polymerase sigma factor [Planctomycetota bacterium]
MRHRDELGRLVRSEAPALVLRYESPDDLLQGVLCEAVRGAAGFTERNELATHGWFATLARRYLIDRLHYWTRLKRGSARVLRLAWSNDSASTSGRLDVADSRTGASTIAQRRELLVTATRALAMLLPRDRELVGGYVHDASIDAEAARLGMSYDACERARLRAIERLRRAYGLLTGAGRAGRDRSR